MGQSSPPQWWEIIVGILSIPATIFGLIYSYYLVQRATLEKQKITLENRKLELEILEKEKKLRIKREVSKKPTSNNKLESILEKVLLDIQTGENAITDLLEKLMTPFKTLQQEKTVIAINNQRVVGSLIELFFLLLFLYTDFNQIANTLNLLIPVQIPSALTNTTIPLFISSVGTSTVLGLMIGDLVGVTSLTSWAGLQRRRGPFLSIMLVTLVVSVALSSLLAIRRLDLIINIPQNIQSSVLVATSIGEGLYIVPTIITTAFLFNGVQGLLIILALPLLLLRFLITIIRKIVERIVYYVSD